MVCWLGHFGRRLFESAFVHVFSGESLGVWFIAKNSMHYWLFGAAIGAMFSWRSLSASAFVQVIPCHLISLGYVVNRPDFEPSLSPSSPLFTLLLLAFWLFQGANAWVHLQHRLARPPGSTARVLPRGPRTHHASATS